MTADAGSAWDVVIVGGGPGGSTAATLLRKYNPSLRVLVLEKEKFPRDHIGESQLPSISRVLHEMGVWDQVEAAGFPIKIGASYTWGSKNDRWDFDFFPSEQFRDEPRPAKYEGQRLFTAFQVDRASYDTILLRHAESMGAEVREETRVEEVLVEDGRITGLRLADGKGEVRGRYYIDASGTVGLLRRALDVPVKVTEELRNIAIWDYWRNAEWAVEIGVGGTRVQVRSLPYGWIWFIPMGPDRTSVGLIVPAEHYKTLKMSPEELYLKALGEQEDIAKLLKNAVRENVLQSCKDWSQLADQIAGDNWFLVGEAAGFADPILAAGMSLAHASARDAAYTILELERGEHDARWLRKRYDDRNRLNIEQHIRFAQYWYSANGCFTDLREHCQRIAAEAGLKLAPQDAWRWLSQGGFITEDPELASFGSFDIFSAKQLINQFDEQGRTVHSLVDGHNTFKLNILGAKKTAVGKLTNGRIERIGCYERAGRVLPLSGMFGLVFSALKQTSDAHEMMAAIQQRASGFVGEQRHVAVQRSVQALEAMIQDGWVQRSVKKGRPLMRVALNDSRLVRSSEVTNQAIAKGAAGTVKANI